MRHLAAIEFRIGKNDAIFINFSLYYLFDRQRNIESCGAMGQAEASDCVRSGKRQFGHFLPKAIDIRPETIEKVKS
jgi:hypothetical protein